MTINFNGRARLLISAPMYRRILVPIIALFITATAFAQSPCTSPVDRKEINIQELFHEIEVKGDVVVILTTAPPGEIMVEGNSSELHTIKAVVKRGKLTIEAEKRKCSSKLTVFVSVTNVDTLIINRESEVFSFGKIKVLNFR